MREESRRRSSRSRFQGDSTAAAGLIERLLNAVGLRFIVYIFRKLTMFLRDAGRSPLVLTLPLFLLLGSTQTDYLILTHPTDSASLLFFSAVPVPVEDARRADAEQLKRSVQAAIYIFTLGLCFLNKRTIVSYISRWPHLAVLIGLVLFSATYSADPREVISNSALVMISIIIPLLFVSGVRGSQSKFYVVYLVFLVPFLLSHTASLLLLFAYGSDPFAIILSTNRYGGFSGNPNSLGNDAVLGLWAATALLLSQGVVFKWRILAGMAIPVFILSIGMSGSGTAIVTCFLAVGATVWMRLLALFKPTLRLGVNILTGASFILLVLSVLLLVSPAELFLVFTDSLGKDGTMTGRTELWAMAKEAIAERPWFGWSFDSHASVMLERRFQIGFNHYHNGFLDTMIDGGIVLISLILYNFAWFVASFITVFRQNNQAFALLVPFVMLIILNMTEYTLLRPLSGIWLLYVTSFIILTYKNIDATASKQRSSDRARRKRSKPAMRWA